MQFLRENQGEAEHAIAARICAELAAGKRVLWLTSGGSNTAIEVAVMDMVRNHAAERLDGLAIMPMDERYGELGHADSNSQALRAAGFDPGAATWVDVLVHNVSFEQTISFYSDVAAAALTNADVVVGQFGIGPDGHVAGVLPGSPASKLTKADTATVVGYEWSDYTRMTLSVPALKRITVAYVPALGAGKQTALERLHANKEPLSILPAKLLYDIAETYIFNDFIETKE